MTFLTKYSPPQRFPISLKDRKWSSTCVFIIARAAADGTIHFSFLGTSAEESIDRYELHFELEYVSIVKAKSQKVCGDSEEKTSRGWIPPS